MLRSTASKVMWVGRATVFLVGLAVVLALVFGVASTALGANGNPFLLGKKNVASAISTLVKQGTGPALKLQVGSGQPPLAVNSTARVANLNADQLDGRDSSAFFRGRQVVQQSATAPPNQGTYDDSTVVTAPCPPGKFALGGGYHQNGHDQGTVQDMVILASRPTSDGTGWEIWVSNTTTFDHTVTAYAVCAIASS